MSMRVCAEGQRRGTPSECEGLQGCWCLRMSVILSTELQRQFWSTRILNGIQRSCRAMPCMTFGYKKSVGLSFVTRPTLGGLRIAHHSWTSNANAHASMYTTIHPPKMTRVAGIYIPMDIYRCLGLDCDLEVCEVSECQAQSVKVNAFPSKIAPPYLCHHNDSSWALRVQR